MKILLACTLVTGMAAAQSVPRPSLGAGHDTNSAVTYYVFGVAQINHDPLKASQGFYWATRINPNLAEAWYGLWAASILSLPDLKFLAYVEGTNSDVKDSIAHQVDSLRDRADYLNPLLHHQLDELILQRLAGGDNLDQYIFGHPDFGAWLAYSRGDFQTAVDRFQRAIRQFPREPGLHWDRAKAFLLGLKYDSALAEMHAYRDAIKARQDKKTWVFLDPHEQSDYAIGRVEELRGNLDQAKQEYEAALIENLGYVPAHVALARLAVARRDTADALKELDLATQTQDADRCYTYGVLLWANRQPREAAAQFTRAIAADSDYAPPYLPLGYLIEASGDDSAAAALYRQFIARASQDLEPQLTTARQHLAAIEARKGAH